MNVKHFFVRSEWLCYYRQLFKLVFSPWWGSCFIEKRNAIACDTQLCDTLS